MPHMNTIKKTPTCATIYVQPAMSMKMVVIKSIANHAIFILKGVKFAKQMLQLALNAGETMNSIQTPTLPVIALMAIMCLPFILNTSTNADLATLFVKLVMGQMKITASLVADIEAWLEQLARVIMGQKPMAIVMVHAMMKVASSAMLTQLFARSVKALSS